MPIERVEISKTVKVEVLKRAGGPDDPRCEGTRNDGERCNLALRGKRYHFDHTWPEWLRTTPKKDRPPITAADCKLLGWDCCHKPKTAREAGERAKDNAVFEKHHGIRSKRKGRPMPGSRASGWKQHIDGSWSRR